MANRDLLMTKTVLEKHGQQGSYYHQNPKPIFSQFITTWNKYENFVQCAATSDSRIQTQDKTTKWNYLLGSQSWRLQSFTTGDEMFKTKYFVMKSAFYPNTIVVSTSFLIFLLLWWGRTCLLHRQTTQNECEMSVTL